MMTQNSHVYDEDDWGDYDNRYDVAISSPVHCMLKKIDMWGCRLTVVVYILTMYKKGEWEEECFFLSSLCCPLYGGCESSSARGRVRRVG